MSCPGLRLDCPRRKTITQDLVHPPRVVRQQVSCKGHIHLHGKEMLKCVVAGGGVRATPNEAQLVSTSFIHVRASCKPVTGCLSSYLCSTLS